MSRDVVSPWASNIKPPAAAIIAIATHVSDRRLTARALIAAAAPPTMTTSTVPYEAKGDNVPVSAASTRTRNSAMRESHKTATGSATNAMGSHSAAMPLLSIATAAAK